MGLTLSRLLSPVIVAWLVLAAAGVVVSLISIQTMRYEIDSHPAALRSPGVAAMKRHNLLAEFMRGLAQLIALAIGIGYVLGWLPSQWIAWGLVLMNLALVSNSSNELLLTLRLLGRWRPVMVHTVSRGPSRPAAVQVDPVPAPEEDSS